MNIGFIGFGEAAFNLSMGLYEEGVRGIRATDTMADHPVMGKLIHERAEAAQVELIPTAQELVAWADVFFTPVPTTLTVDLCRSIKDQLGPGKIYADVSASTPKTKEKIWEIIRDTGVLFADAALLGSLPASRHKVPVMAGPAFTVKGRAGDNLALHAALNYCREGDVIVVSNEGDETRSLIGAVMMTWLCYYKKIAGIVIDGPIRDIDEIGTWDFPVYCTGTTPGGPYKEGPGEVNVPVACGNISVNPGDVIVGDADGVICIPRKDAPAVLEAAKKFQANDRKKEAASKDGSVDRSWVERSLEAKGFEIIDDVYRP